MENRPVTKFVLSASQKEVELKDWLTARERREINQAAFGDSEVSARDISEQRFKGNVIVKMQDALITAYVQKFDDSTENIFDRLLELQDSDYQEVTSLIAGIENKNKDAVKT